MKYEFTIEYNTDRFEEADSAEASGFVYGDSLFIATGVIREWLTKQDIKYTDVTYLNIIEVVEDEDITIKDIRYFSDGTNVTEIVQDKFGF